MSKTRDTGFLANVIQVHDTGVRIMSGSEMLMAISSSGAVTITGELSGSDAANSLLLNGTGSVGFTTTGSFSTASGSASSRLTQIEAVYATTGSNSFRATQSITGSLTVTGQIIAQTINVQQVTSSIVYSSGSNVFGCDINSRQTFTGSFYQTGSVAVFNSCVGIGLNNPTNRLEVQSGDIKLNAGASRCTSVFFGITGTNYGRIQYSDMDGSMLITTMGAGSGYDLNLGTKCITRLTISGDGNVGILTCTPQQILSVNNPFSSLNALYPIVISQTGNAEIGGMYSTADSITNPIGAGLAFKTYQINVGLTEKIRITHAGYMGIGCTAPSGKLQVVNSSTQYAVYTLGGNLELYTPEGNCGYVRLGSAYNLNGVYGSCGLNYITAGTSNHVFYTTDSVCERMRITNTGITTFACNICVAKYLTVGSQGGGDIVFLGGGSGVGAAIEARYADGNPNVRFAGNGNSWINRTYGNVGIGTCTPSYMLDVNGAINTSAGTLYSNNVVTYAVGGYMLGTTAAYYDFPAWNDGGQGQMFEVKAFFDHFYNWAYGAHYYVYLTTRETLSQALTMFNCSTGNGGSWMAYKPNTTTLRVCKLAGTYAGGGAYWVQVTARQP